MSKWLKIGAAVGVALLVLGSFAGMYFGLYNDIITARNDATLKWSEVLSAYEQNFVNVAQSAQVAKFSVNAQLNLTLMYAALREGHDIDATNPDKMNEAVATLDETAALFMIAVRQEAVPQLDTTQLTELNAVIESTLRVVRETRDNFSTAVTEYNNIIQTFPGVWFNDTFWHFKPLKTFQPKVDHPPEENIDLGLP